MKITKRVMLFIFLISSGFALAGNSLPEYTAVDSKLSAKAKEEAISQWLLRQTEQVGGELMPHSYADSGYWHYLAAYNDDYQHYSDSSPEASLTERVMMHNGLDIYDGAVWSMALALDYSKNNSKDNKKAVMSYMRFLEKGTSPGFQSYRAYFVPDLNAYYRYGWDNLSILDNRNQSYFLKFIAAQYANNTDPLTGKQINWPEFSAITGEEAWAAFIGPIQSAYLLNNGKENPMWATSAFSEKMIDMAADSLSAVEAMQSPVGAIYYSVKNPSGPTPGEHQISVENNLSMYAGLNLLKQALEAREKATGEVDTELLERVNHVIDRMDDFFRGKFGPVFDKDGFLYTFGHVTGGQWQPDTKTFAVDVQTWGIAVLGDKLNQWYGADSSWKMWQKTKLTGGFYDSENDGALLGVGYTMQKAGDTHYELSGEWTFGAINAVKTLQHQYQQPERQKVLAGDLSSMERAMDERLSFYNPSLSELSYLYADRRAFIPFGWFSNKIPATASTAWALFMLNDFNPFVLGGK